MNTEDLRNLLVDLQPIPRSISGDGVRLSLRRIEQELQRFAPQVQLEAHEVPTGAQVLDWTVPQEWSLRSASISDSNGNRIIDIANCGLHVIGYSEPVDTVMSFEELLPRLHWIEGKPDWVPYRTSYHSKTWGFCVSENQLQALRNAGNAGPLSVQIESELFDGALTYGEIVIPGTTEKELLLSTHICHPWMANDNASGLVAATATAIALAQQPLQHTIRVLFLPSSIGAIAWLSRHGEAASRKLDGGLVITGLGDSNGLTYKPTRHGNSLIDRIALDRADVHTIAWDPYGYDERQFGSPGFDLPVGRLTRGVHGRYPEYHTSADNLSFVSINQLEASIRSIVSMFRLADNAVIPRRVDGRGEPQLGKRGLYRSTGGAIDHRSPEMAYLWVLALADGKHSLHEIARQSGVSQESVDEAFRRLVEQELIY